MRLESSVHEDRWGGRTKCHPATASFLSGVFASFGEFRRVDDFRRVGELATFGELASFGELANTGGLAIWRTASWR